jgi:spore cortex formation protein SpoVR/YcgB (stage V sporulation)
MTRKYNNKKIDSESLQELQTAADELHSLAHELGLSPPKVNYWLIDHDEINQLAAYQGFPVRYPHWRWGMKYSKRNKEDTYFSGKIFELVNHDTPANAFNQISNSVNDHKGVIAHVEAHADFFENNHFFENKPDATGMMERHANLIQSYYDDPKINQDDVEEWIDAVLCIESTIDPLKGLKEIKDDTEVEEQTMSDVLDSLDVSDEVKRHITAGIPEEESKEKELDVETDLLKFILEHGKQYNSETGKAEDYEHWQKSIIEIIRRESYYFSAQQMTKIMNEGWACVDPSTRVITENGIIPMKEAVNTMPSVSDGETTQKIYDKNIFEDYDTVTIRTNKGYELTGSHNHRIMNNQNKWVEMGDLSTGDAVKISGGNNIWPDTSIEIDWEIPSNNYITVEDISNEAGLNVSTYYEYKNNGCISENSKRRIENAISQLDYDSDNNNRYKNKKDVVIPTVVDNKFAEFLGMLIADGHISKKKRELGFTYGSKSMAKKFSNLSKDLFGTSANITQDKPTRWRAKIYSVDIINFLIDEIGLTNGESSSDKSIPEVIFRSPKDVVSSFVSALISCDGYCGEKEGIIYTTKSKDISKQLQTILLNYNIISSRKKIDADGCWRMNITGLSSKKFADEIGIIDRDKKERLYNYINNRKFYNEEKFADEIVDIENGIGDVYDISVENTHKYEAAGFLNHNSKWESTMMSDEAYAGPDEIIDYADKQSMVLNSPGLNPYKIGKEMWEYIENRVNRREVISTLLRVKGITWRNFHDSIDFKQINQLLDKNRDMDIPCERNYSLLRSQNKGFIKNISKDELKTESRYMFDMKVYNNIEEAIENISYNKAWERMREIRETHNDITFIDSFLTDEFVKDEKYFAYEYNAKKDQMQVSSTSLDAVKKKLLLQITNGGRPTIVAADYNYQNSGELLLKHQYNGVSMNIDKAKNVLKRIFELWGHTVNLKTITKNDRGKEKGLIISYDGNDIHENEVKIIRDIKADQIDYDTKPDEWL